MGAGGEMNQALYAHMNNKRKMKKKKQKNKVWGRMYLITVNTQQAAAPYWAHFACIFLLMYCLFQYFCFII
jgi:plasmid rolling circle replication initiator protein Rep